MKFPDWQREKWSDCTKNPVIGFYTTPECGFAIGDPQILTPGQFDSKWHAFYHGYYENFTPYYHHLVSEDGVAWTLKKKWPWKVNPSFLFHYRDEWLLYNTLLCSGEQRFNRATNIISIRRSRDLENWTEPEPLLWPEFDWELEYMPVNYTSIEVRNPCVVRLGENHYRMYYSAGTVMLPHCGYEEPKYISFADAPTPFGPFKKHGKPIISPDASVPHRNFGAGAIKVFGYGDRFLGLYNSIYVDESGYPHSAINLIMSGDGIEWEEAPFNPIIPPAPGGEGFKKEFVYQLDLVRFNGELRMYYNGRNKWRDGIERIGMSSIPDDPAVKKLWDLE